MPKQTELNDKQKLFIHHFLLTRNATEAARKAGYGAPAKSGPRVRRHPLVDAEIRRFEKEAQEKFELTHEKIINELIKVAFDDKLPVTIGDVLDWDTSKINLISKEAMKALPMKYIKSMKQVIGKNGELGVQVEMKEHDKVKALIKLGEHMGMWVRTGRKDGDKGEEGDQREPGGEASDPVFERLHRIAESAGK